MCSQVDKGRPRPQVHPRTAAAALDIQYLHIRFRNVLDNRFPKKGLTPTRRCIASGLPGVSNPRMCLTRSGWRQANMASIFPASQAVAQNLMTEAMPSERGADRTDTVAGMGVVSSGASAIPKVPTSNNEDFKAPCGMVSPDCSVRSRDHR